MSTVRLTAAQAMVKYLAAQLTPEGDRFIHGVWAIFGHGNVGGWARPCTASRTNFQRGAARTNKRWRMLPLFLQRPASVAAPWR